MILSKKFKIIYVLFLCILVGMLSSCSNNHTTVKEKIDQANDVQVYIPIDKDTGTTLDMNLFYKKYYGDKDAVKGDTVYGYEDTFPSKWLGFNYTKKINLLYPIIADETTESEVKRSNYVIVKNVKNGPEPKKIIDVWHDDGFKGYKVKIFYNHDCLPVKVQLIDRDTNNWKTVVTYSYPHITAKQYEKNWEKYRKEVKEGYYVD